MISSDLTDDRLREIAENAETMYQERGHTALDIADFRAIRDALLAAREEIAKLRVLTGDRTAQQEAARLYAKGYNGAVRGGYNVPPIAPEIARLTRERDEARLRVNAERACGKLSHELKVHAEAEVARLRALMDRLFKKYAAPHMEAEYRAALAPKEGIDE